MNINIIIIVLYVEFRYHRYNFTLRMDKQEKYYGLFTLNHLVYDLGSSFAKFNKNFNYDKFIQACGVQTLLIELG